MEEPIVKAGDERMSERAADDFMLVMYQIIFETVIVSKKVALPSEE